MRNELLLALDLAFRTGALILIILIALELSAVPHDGAEGRLLRRLFWVFISFASLVCWRWIGFLDRIVDFFPGVDLQGFAMDWVFVPYIGVITALLRFRWQLYRRLPSGEQK